VVSFTHRTPYPQGKSPWYPLDIKSRQKSGCGFSPFTCTVEERIWKTELPRMVIFVDSGFVSSPPLPDRHWITGALCLGVKRLGREANHSSPPSDKVKNTWSYTSTHPRWTSFNTGTICIRRRDRGPDNLQRQTLMVSVLAY
jgi:hypothetical protein